jgi:hypothetical protein
MHRCPAFERDRGVLGESGRPLIVKRLSIYKPLSERNRGGA